jgi:hypothetical protein
MAAIIAKITRENRERIKRRKNTIPIKKSRYSLPAFKDYFDPEEDIKVFTNKKFHLESDWDIIGLTGLAVIEIKKGTPKEYLIRTFEELRINSFLNTD